MRLTLDWDDADTVQQHYGTAEGIRAAQGLQKQEFRSANGQARMVDVADADGNHLERPDKMHYVLYGMDASVNDMMAARANLGDDGRRLTLDRRRWNRGSPHLQILFRTKYVPVREVPDEGPMGAPVHPTGKHAQLIGGTGLGYPPAEQVKRPGDGSLMYPKIARLLVDLERTRFDSGAELMDRIKQRANVTYTKRSADLFYDIKTGKRNWVTGNATTQAQRAVKKALRDWAEAEDIGHYQGGRAGENTPAEPLTEPAVRRRAYCEYIDIVWDRGGKEDRAGSDYFRELNITTSSHNENHTNPQIHYTHQDVARHAMDVLNPTSEEGNTLEHQRGPAPSRAEANPRSALQEDIVRAGDSRMWSDAPIELDERDAYLGNLPTNRRTHDLSDREVRRAGEVHPVFEVTLYDEDGESAIWHVIGVDDTDSGESITNATILKETVNTRAGGSGWW